MSIIKLNNQLRRVEIKEFEIENNIVFNFFDKLPSQKENGKFFELYILACWL